MPTARSSAAVAVLDGRLHAIGSATLDEFPMSSWTDVHEVFDPFTGTWSSRARPPSVGGGYAAAAIGGRLYLVDNGWEQQLHVYEPAADSWTTIAAPQGRSDAAAATLGGKVYVLGGGEYQLDCCSGTIPVAVVDRLDPHTGVWDRVPPMPTPWSGHGAAVVGQSIYVIGGSPIGPNIGFGAVNERLTAR
jgi:N-acetylneuraminic acid mutarotase